MDTRVTETHITEGEGDHRAPHSPKNAPDTPSDNIQVAVAKIQASGSEFLLENEAQRILREMLQTDQKAWGFKVYRLTYKDNSKWKESIGKLDTEARKNLKKSGPEGDTLIEKLNWAVEDDKEKWDGASFAHVRDHFKKLIDIEKPTNKSAARYVVCIAVDDECLESAFLDGQLKVDNPPLRQWPFIKALDVDFDEEKARRERLEKEQGYREYLQSCQGDGKEITENQWIYEHDEPIKVGYLKVPLPLVVPALYHRLDEGFDEVYRCGSKPPKIWVV
ncbi:Twin arginine translocation protein [Neofusicoccum parvum]|uniref:Twin arginine translocation protein n=1 Tax=Neofusicoccum parvum TaxID=310453 RepID=A0ACB5S119_9PEZI|nr:Twin arginine translocation protein [Neofusicoccum parvum]